MLVNDSSWLTDSMQQSGTRDSSYSAKTPRTLESTENKMKQQEILKSQAGFDLDMIT